MRQAEIYFKNNKAGLLTQHNDGSFTYEYNNLWMLDISKPPISLTLPKTNKIFHSKFLFSFFFNMLPEGTNKQVVCKYMRIDKDDHFGLLLTTARLDTIGAVTVKKIKNTI